MSNEPAEDARILIVDDEDANVVLLEQILRRAGYVNVACTQDPRDVSRLFRDFRPDLLLLDLHMPFLDGFAVMRQMETAIPRKSFFPILVLTADILPEAKQRALSMGAKDFLLKPFDATEVLLRIHNLLTTRFLYLELQKQNDRLEDKVRDRTRALELAQSEMLERLARASESRDDDTGQHTQRVGRLSAMLAATAGLPERQVELIRQAAPLHDIGKIGIPDPILLKADPLTPAEFEIMKTHTSIGAHILGGSGFPLMRTAEQITLYHHEKWDGSGYYRLSGEGIPLAARIVALADVFDVLTHARPYKEAWPVERALAEIERQSGRHFDPALVEVFLREQWRNQLAQLTHAITDGTDESPESNAIAETVAARG